MQRLAIISNHLSSLIKTEILDSQIAILTLNRPEKFNALSPALIDSLNLALKSLESNPNVRLYILCGSGKHFSVGADINQFRDLTPSSASISNPLDKWSELLPNLTKPIIAAVHGLALGGGCEIAMMCDIIICEKSAKFGQPEIRLGLIPGAGGCQRLPRAVGKAKAMDMILTGETISAEEAKNLGLVSRVVEGDVLKEAVEVGKKIAKHSLAAIALAKRAVLNSFEVGLNEGIKVERSYFNVALGLEDKTEGIKALFEKREAKFKDR